MQPERVECTPLVGDEHAPFDHVGLDEEAATELDAESFAVYWMLKKEGVEAADDVATAAAEAFEQYPHWQTSGKQEQEVRKAFYKALIDAGCENVVETAQRVLRVLRGERS